MEEEKNRAEKMAQACFDSIKDMFTRYDEAIKKDDEEKQESISTEIEESNYSISVTKFYSIELAGGGPAVRIFGELADDDQPATAELQFQDWGTPWIELRSVDNDILIRYAEHFYYAMNNN